MDMHLRDPLMTVAACARTLGFSAQVNGSEQLTLSYLILDRRLFMSVLTWETSSVNCVWVSRSFKGSLASCSILAENMVVLATKFSLGKYMYREKHE